MTGNEAELPGLGTRFADGTREVFASRARWVQTWILSRALPLAALLAMAIACRAICAGRSPLESGDQHALAGLLLSVALVRALRPLWHRQWQTAVGSYQASIVYCSLILILGAHDESQSAAFWTVLIAGFWLMGLAYSSRLIMPGEFAFASLTLAGMISACETPLPGWLFVLLVFGAIAVWLGRRSHWKPVLLLTALILLLWTNAEVAGGHVALVVVAAVGIIWGAVYSMKRLTGADSSSFMRSVGLGVVSGLLMFISFSLLHFSANEVVPWLVSALIFAALAASIRKSQGVSWTPLLLLWCVHWSFCLYVVTWNSLFHDDEVWSVHTGTLLAALVLRAAAVRLNSNRTLVWARVYFQVCALGMLMAMPFRLEGTSWHLFFVLCLMPIALWLAQPRSLGVSPPWWKGVVNPRHVVAMRNMMHSGGEWIAKVPFVGATVSAIVQGLKVVIQMKRAPRRFDSGDALLVVCIPLFAVVCGHYLGLIHIPQDRIVPLVLDSHDWSQATHEEQQQLLKAAQVLLERSSKFPAAGLLFLVAHWVRRDPIYAMLAMVSFCIGPVTIANDGKSVSPLFWITLLVSAAGIMAAKDVQEREIKPHIATRVA